LSTIVVVVAVVVVVVVVVVVKTFERVSTDIVKSLNTRDNTGQIPFLPPK